MKAEGGDIWIWGGWRRTAATAVVRDSEVFLQDGNVEELALFEMGVHRYCRGVWVPFRPLSASRLVLSFWGEIR